jgi:anion-transporting  ArsA/GET3 family ATPase
MQFRSSQTFCNEVEKHFSQQSLKLSIELTEKLSWYLRQGTDITFRVKSKNVKHYLLLCAMSHWIPDENLKILLQMFLLEKYRKFGEEYEQKISLLLNSKTETLLYLQQQNTIWRNSSEFFGDLCSLDIKVKLIILRPRKPKRIQRHRGYRDKGSLSPNSQIKHEEKKDFSLTELQNQLELERIAIQDSILFWRGFIE